jgi:cytochrome P450
MLPALRRDPIETFRDAARRFGEVAYFEILDRRGYLATNPDDIKHVLQDNARNYKKSPLYEKLKTVVGEGLVTSEGAFWLRQRRIVQPAFHRQRVAGLVSVMAQAASEAADAWETTAVGRDSIDVGREMMHVTRTIILRTMFGTELGPLEGEVDGTWTVVNQHIGQSFWSLGLTERWPTPRNLQYRRALAVLDRAVFGIIEQRRRDARDAGDLLSMLLFARDEETGDVMTDHQLRDEVMTIFLAGHETTSLALTWIWYLLSQHPDAARRLEAEVDTALQGRTPGFEDLARLPYTRMVIEEAMRLYPPAWGFSRQALGPDTIGGYHLPTGWLVFVVPAVMHRLPAYWADPDRFDPLRFTPEQTAARPKFVYLPFGAGPRQCIGNQFALIEAQVIVATLAQRYRLHLLPGHPVEPWPLVTLRPRYGMKMIVERRSTPAWRESSRESPAVARV